MTTGDPPEAIGGRRAMTKHECPYEDDDLKERVRVGGWKLLCRKNGRLCDSCKEDRADTRMDAAVDTICLTIEAQIAEVLAPRIVEAIAAHEDRADRRARGIMAAVLMSQGGPRDSTAADALWNTLSLTGESEPERGEGEG